jgi:hypothetical protein
MALKVAGFLSTHKSLASLFRAMLHTPRLAAARNLAPMAAAALVPRATVTSSLGSWSLPLSPPLSPPPLEPWPSPLHVPLPLSMLLLLLLWHMVVAAEVVEARLFELLDRFIVSGF